MRIQLKSIVKQLDTAASHLEHKIEHYKVRDSNVLLNKHSLWRCREMRIPNMAKKACVLKPKTFIYNKLEFSNALRPKYYQSKS